MANKLNYLWKRYAANTCSPEEYEELMDYLRQPEYREQIQQLIEEEYEVKIPGEELPEMDWDFMFSRAVQEGNFPAGEKEKVELPVRSNRIQRIMKWSAAAAVLGLIAIGVYHISSRHQHPVSMPVAGRQAMKKEILPGGNKATLTLGNGQVIVLEDRNNGVLAQQGSVQVVKHDSGSLSYVKAMGTSDTDLVYNQLNTPRGGQFQVTLPDGTKVWLNAASSIRYPTVFAGGERKVFITGEVYFEVAAQVNKPFKVSLNDNKAAIEVLGTHFNINAYTNETIIRTTLLEGSVKVSGVGGSVLLRPGQQAKMPQSGQPGVITVQEADVEEAVAWKRGLFYFNNAGLETVMRQLERWYDVDVSFEGNIPDRRFEGKIQRKLTLTEVLEALEKNGVYCKATGRKIVVLPSPAK